MNVHDSEKIAGVLAREGYCSTCDPRKADIIIYNTCSIREKAEQKFYSELGRVKSLKRKRPDLKIAVAGCIAQQQGRGVFRRAPHVDLVFGPQNIHLLNDLLRGGSQAVADEDNPLIADMDLPVVRKPGGRAWVSIMYGCNNFCSYCIVPYTRGRERSRPTENILKEISELGRDGYREVILLGQNVNSYKSDTDFAGLLRKINSVRWIERIRFVTSHPRDLSDGLASAFEELPKVCEHLHLPLQSGSSRILDLMNRGYTFDEYKEIVTKLRKKIKGLSFTTDIITGFPGETEEDHEDTLKALKKLEFDGIFAFKYSPRPGTVATLMDSKVDDAVASRRLTEILDLQDSITLKKNRSYEGTYQEILVEGPSESDSELLTGRTRTNKIVNFRGRDGQTGSFARVRIVEGRRHSLLGSLM